MCAIVSKATGEVRFTDASGNLILAEDERQEFPAYRSAGTKAYTVRQVFQSPDDEAFYGLGQHQADEFNYKGKERGTFPV